MRREGSSPALRSLDLPACCRRLAAMNGDGEQLALAADHFRAGRLAQAESLCRAVLAKTPAQPHALHLLGVIAHHSGRHEDAIALINQALAVHGPEPAFQ